MFYYLLSMNPVLIAAAVIPAIILLIRVYKADRLEPEPASLLIKIVIAGIISTWAAGLMEGVLESVLGILCAPGSLFYYIILYFGIVALSEEGVKYFAAKICTWRSPEFDCRFDGVVYAVFSALGFALWENIQYVYNYGLYTALVRAVTSVPGHACFGVFMGIFYGEAKQAEQAGDLEGAKLNRILAVLVPSVLHGCYDFIATISDGGLYTVLFIVFVILMFVYANKMLNKISKNDRYLNSVPQTAPLSADNAEVEQAVEDWKHPQGY